MYLCICIHVCIYVSIIVFKDDQIWTGLALKIIASFLSNLFITGSDVQE